MELVCPVCATHQAVTAQPVAESTVVCTCDECGTIFTVQVGVLKRTQKPIRGGPDPRDSSSSAGR